MTFITFKFSRLTKKGKTNLLVDIHSLVSRLPHGLHSYWIGSFLNANKWAITFLLHRSQNLRHFSFTCFLFQKINIYLYSSTWNGLLFISNTSVFCLASSQLNLNMKVAWYRSIPLQTVDEVPLLNIWIWQSQFLIQDRPKHLNWIEIGTFLWPFEYVHLSILPFFLGQVLMYGQGGRSCLNMYTDLFGNFSIDCVNSCCRTSQYNVPFIVPSKNRCCCRPTSWYAYLPPITQCSFVGCNLVAARSSSVLQIFTWFFRLRTSKVDSSVKIPFGQSCKVECWSRWHHCTRAFRCFSFWLLFFNLDGILVGKLLQISTHCTLGSTHVQVGCYLPEWVDYHRGPTFSVDVHYDQKDFLVEQIVSYHWICHILQIWWLCCVRSISKTCSCLEIFDKLKPDLYKGTGWART